MTFNKRELGTVLAALRYWQRSPSIRQPEYGICLDGGIIPLGADEIDELCENINCYIPPDIGAEGLLKEFMQDVRAVGVKQTGIEWPDLLVTYNKARLYFKVRE